MRQTVQLNRHPLPCTESYLIQDAHCNNLKNVDIELPKGILSVVTGVAGAGKSLLIRSTLKERLSEAVMIDQRLIGASIRSIIATCIGIRDEIRGLFGQHNGISPARFSFHSKETCPCCKGKGMAFA